MKLIVCGECIGDLVNRNGVRYLIRRYRDPNNPQGFSNTIREYTLCGNLHSRLKRSNQIILLLLSMSIQSDQDALATMGILSENMLPVSEIAKRLLVTKSQMTRLIDQLISSGIVERQTGAHDRRVVNITLTENGRVVSKECRELLRTKIRNRLSCLNKRELDELSLSLARLREIGSRLE